MPFMGQGLATLFIIIKERSERVPNKNFRLINGLPLHEFYMRQRELFNIYIDTDSNIIESKYQEKEWEHVNAYKRLDKHIELEKLPGLSPAPLMIERFIKEYWMSDKAFICSHVTSPFILDETMIKALAYMKDYDSVSSVEAIQEFAVSSCGSDFQPINFSLDRIQKTQSLTPIGILNGAFFIIKPSVFMSNGLRRISSNHYFYPISKKEALDIDTEFDFQIAKLIAESK